ncbi:hypothetical protein OUZ56_005589 [Daphnia magna]|uniref:Uncharacterized protein n=1 Tax=Daphnia magna TaxID=35525 RepID=A0ABQ9YT72_9CRUS|nr:hypothetical protein OUZ56_005589 [Daphnia magna]
MIEWRMTSGWIQIQDQFKGVYSAAPIFCEDLLATHITQCSPSDVRQMSRSDVEYIFFISAGQPDIRFECSMDVFFVLF